MVLNATREQVKAILEKMAAAQGVKVLKFKRYSPYADDEHLYTVLCQFTNLPDKSYNKYVTWLANICPGIEGFGHGHYFEGYAREISVEEIIKKANEDYILREYAN